MTLRGQRRATFTANVTAAFQRVVARVAFGEGSSGSTQNVSGPRGVGKRRGHGQGMRDDRCIRSSFCFGSQGFPAEYFIGLLTNLGRA